MADAVSPLEWVGFARDDLRTAQMAMRDVPPMFGITCYHAQQHAEKMLKACIAVGGEEPPWVHVLVPLIARAKAFGLLADHLIDDAQLLTSLSRPSRYPGDRYTPTLVDAQAAILAAERIGAAARECLLGQSVRLP